LHPSSGVLKTACAITGTSHRMRYLALKCKIPPTYDYLITELNYHILWLVPVVAHEVFRTPDDGCKEHPKHVEKSCNEIKYIQLSVASRWKLIYIRLVMHGTMNVKHCSLFDGNKYKMKNSVL
jgi:hypothetical protein